MDRVLVELYYQICAMTIVLKAHVPKISTALEIIAQIYLPYLPTFASLASINMFKDWKYNLPLW